MQIATGVWFYTAVAQCNMTILRLPLPPGPVCHAMLWTAVVELRARKSLPDAVHTYIAVGQRCALEKLAVLDAPLRGVAVTPSESSL